MKLHTTHPFHLTYCSNIHPGESWFAVFDNLKTYIPELKQRLAPEQSFGLGLRLADEATYCLQDPHTLTPFQQWLAAENVYVFTLNGFPFGGFHRQVVKDYVYAPDWSQEKRLHYTLRLANILASLLPQEIDGGISTVPLSYKPWWYTEEERTVIYHQSALHLAEVAAQLHHLAECTGKRLHLDLEPEPDALLENSSELVDFFQEWLLPVGGKYLVSEYGIPPDDAEVWLRHHIQVCYDTCHFAVEYESPSDVLKRFHAAGIQIGKVQLSAAIQVQLPFDPDQRKMIGDRLQPFAESTYLHQVIERHEDGRLCHYPDLIDALPHLARTPAVEWRTHFHVPIFLQDYQTLQSTQDHIQILLAELPQWSHCQHLEIETYTWDVLPPDMKLDLSTSIQREYEWVFSLLTP